MLSETKTSWLFTFYCLHVICRYMESWSPSRWLLKLFFLKSNDVLDAVLGTDLGEQRCFWIPIKAVCILKQNENNLLHDRSETIRCLWFLWCEDVTCDWLQHNKHSRHILGVHANIITAVSITAIIFISGSERRSVTELPAATRKWRGASWCKPP